MGKVIFLNESSRSYHEENGIKIKNPPELKMIQGSKEGVVTKRKKTTKKVTKEKRQTMGQRIFESLQDKGPNGIA